MEPRNPNRLTATSKLLRFGSVKTMEKCHDTRIYDVDVVFSTKEERSLEPKRISSTFPSDQNCDGKFKLKLTSNKLRSDAVNIEILYANSKCVSPATRHQCKLSINLKINSRYVIKNMNLNLYLLCHTWRYLKTINARLSDQFEFNIKVTSPIQPRALTFEALEEETIKDFTIQGANGFSKKVHKSVLMYSSAAFRKILKRSNKNCISLKADSVTISEFIDYMYYGKQPQSNLTQVLKLARQFEMKDLADKCIAELFDTVNVYNALKLLNFAVANDCPSLVYRIVYFIKLHSEEIVNENVRVMTNGGKTSNDLLSSFIYDYVECASDVLAIKKELFPNDV